MPRYAYQALDVAGAARKGTLEAADRDAAMTAISRLNLRPMEVKERKQGSITLTGLGKPTKPKLTNLVIFARQFATMYDAGVKAVQCLEAMERQTTDPALKPAITAVRLDVLEGANLTEAFARHPNCFPPIFINMVRAGEAGGIMPTVLDRVASFLESQHEITQKVKSAMMYPTIVISLSLLITMGLMVFVVPKFAEIFLGLNAQLPLPTRILMAVSGAMQKFWWVGVLGAVGTVFGLKRYGKTEQGRYNLDKAWLRVPIVGDLLLKMTISRFARTFSTLQNAGVPIMKSLEIVAEATGNTVIQKAVLEARDSIREGNRLTDPLEASGWFPNMVTQMISIGEETGRLSGMLEKVSEFYDKEVDSAVKGLVSAIEPLMIAFMGVLIGSIAVALLMPIFDLQKQLQHH
ncbi:MAG TPA: type II secretion system F family protein [Armatimonadota bacterium]